VSLSSQHSKTDEQVRSFPVSPLGYVDTWECDQSGYQVSPISPLGRDSSRPWSTNSAFTSIPPSSPGSPFLGKFATPSAPPSVTYSNIKVTAAPIDIPTSGYASAYHNAAQESKYSAHPSFADRSPALTDYGSLTPVSRSGSVWSRCSSKSSDPASSIYGLQIPMAQYKDVDYEGLVNLVPSTPGLWERQTTNLSRFGDMIGKKTQSMVTGFSRMWAGRARCP